MSLREEELIKEQERSDPARPVVLPTSPVVLPTSPTAGEAAEGGPVPWL